MGKEHQIVSVTLGLVAGLLMLSCQSNELSIRDDQSGLNGSFETTVGNYPVNWAFFPNPQSENVFNITVDTTKAREGNNSLRLTTSQSHKTVGFRSSRVPVEAGNTYHLSIAFQNEGCNLKVRRIVQDFSGTDNIRSDIIYNTSSTLSHWEIFEEFLSVSEGERYVVFVFLVDGPGTLWIDDVRVEKVNN